MKLEEFRKDAHFFTGKVSELTRQLAYAGIGIIWVFRITKQTGEPVNPQIPNELIFPLFLLVITLSLDFLQYVYGAIIWTYFHRKKEREGVKEDADIKAPIIYSSLTYVFWGSKIIAITVFYILIILFLLKRLL